MTRVLFALLSVVLSGCAAITEPFGMQDPFAIPTPFQGVERNDRMIAQAIEVPALVVEAPVGLGPELAGAVRDHVVAAARKHDVPALDEPTAMAWVLRAQAAALRSADGKGKPVERVVLTWELVDSGGKVRAQFGASFASAETDVSESAVALLAEQTVENLDVALRRPRTQVAEAAPVAAEKPTVWVGVIKGAPGDGNKALAQALSAILPLKGVRIEAKKAKAQWRIEGAVKVTSASDKQDMVTLTWRVLDAKGKEAGTIAQRNPVPKGSLNKAWGQSAAFAAEAAAEGIAQLIQQVSAPKRS